jgi:hypothetical protein
MTFLPDHPDETGCCDLRFAVETSRDGSPLKNTFALGYFLTLGIWRNGRRRIRHISRFFDIFP